MVIPSNWPTAMVILASEQLWPNIHGLAYWHENLRHLFICSTKDKQKSAEPAERLEALCQEVWPRVKVHRLADGIGMQPQEVFAQVLGWRAEKPGERWLLNASGGTKLMHDGLLPMVGQEDVEVVYRELTGPWYRFRRGQILETETIDLPVEATDRLPVEALIRAQWHMNGATIEFGAEESPIDWRRAIDEGTRTRWNWRSVAGVLGLETSAGPLFERLIEAVLREMGVSELTRTVIRKAEVSHVQSLQEIDIVVNHAGRLVIIDCKLIGEEDEEERGEPITSQIRQAAHTRRELGGLGASLVLLRPNRLLNDEEQALAEAYGLTVIDRDATTELFSRLAESVGVRELPPALRQAEEEMCHAWESHQVRPFCREQTSPRVAAVIEAGETEAVVDLNAYRRRYDGQDWVAWQLFQEVRIGCEVPGELTRGQVLTRVERLFRGLGYLGTELSASGRNCTIRLQVARRHWPALRALLESRLRRPLLG
jgi:hypothetical protein